MNYDRLYKLYEIQADLREELETFLDDKTFEPNTYDCLNVTVINNMGVTCGVVDVAYIKDGKLVPLEYFDVKYADEDSDKYEVVIADDVEYTKLANISINDLLFLTELYLDSIYEGE